MPHLIHTGEGTGVGLGQNETSRLSSVCSRVTLLTSAGRTPASSRHTVLFSLILGRVGGRCLSREALQTCAGGGGFVAAHRERAARHAPHSGPPTRTRGQLSPTPGVFLVRIQSPASRRFSQSVKCPPFFFLPQTQWLLSLKGGGQNWSAGLSAESAASGALPRQAPRRARLRPLCSPSASRFLLSCSAPAVPAAPPQAVM